MAIRTSEEQQAGLQVLSSVNTISKLGGSDSTISGNATITALIEAIKLLPNTIGSEQVAANAVARGLRLGVNIGAYAESHGFSTIAGMRDAVWSQLSADIDRNTDRHLPQ